MRTARTAAREVAMCVAAALAVTTVDADASPRPRRSSTLRFVSSGAGYAVTPRGQVRLLKHRERTFASAKFARLHPGSSYALQWDAAPGVAVQFTADARGRARMRGMEVPEGVAGHCPGVAVLDANGDPVLVHDSVHMDSSDHAGCDHDGSGMHGGSNGGGHSSHHGGSGSGGDSMHGGGMMMK